MSTTTRHGRAALLRASLCPALLGLPLVFALLGDGRAGQAAAPAMIMAPVASAAGATPKAHAPSAQSGQCAAPTSGPFQLLPFCLEPPAEVPPSVDGTRPSRVIPGRMT